MYNVVNFPFLPFYGAILWETFASKDGFDKLESWWLFYFHMLIWSLIKYPRAVLVIIIAILPFPRLWMPIMFKIMFYFAVFTKAKGSLLWRTSQWWFEQLGVKIITVNNVPKSLTSGEIAGFPNEPTIYLCNYPSNMIEYFYLFMSDRKPKLLIWEQMAKTFVKPIYGEEFMIYVSGKNSWDDTRKSINSALAEGCNIFAYIERDYYKRKNNKDIMELRTGIFKMHDLHKDWNVRPLQCGHFYHFCGLLLSEFISTKYTPPRLVIGPKLSSSDDLAFRMQQVRNHLSMTTPLSLSTEK